MKSVFGFRVRLGNPDLPIERTVDSHTNSVISHAVVKMASKTVTRSFTQDTDKTYLKAYPLSKQRVLYIGIPSCCLYLRVIFSTFILLDKIIVPIKPCDMSLNEVMFLIFFCV